MKKRVARKSRSKSKSKSFSTAASDKDLENRVSNLENVNRSKETMPYLNDALAIRPLPTDDISIQKSVNKLLSGLDYAKVAFIAGADLNSAKIAVMVNLGSGFSFAGFLDKPYHGQLSGGAQLVFVK